MTSTTTDGYDIVFSLIHEYTKTQSSPHTIDGLTLWLLRRKVYELQQHKDVIRNKILQEADEFSKQKEMKQ